MAKKETNPLVDTGLLGKIKTSVGSKKDAAKTTVQNGSIYGTFVAMNDSMRICAETSACCWDKPIPELYEDKAEYVAKRVRVGHTSVMEHSNFVTYFRVPMNYVEDLVTFLSECNYLSSWAHKTNNGDGFHLLIGGSLRGYSDLYRETSDMNNVILKAITGILKVYSNSAAFGDIGKLGLIDLDGFMNVDPSINDTDIISTLYSESNELFDVVSVDDMDKLVSKIWAIDPEVVHLLKVYDLLPFLSVTINFKNMSRIITQQLCRHRNGITQESQRYVDYSKSAFNSPAKYVSKYDDTHKYAIRFGTSSPVMHLTLQELGEAMGSVYEQLNNPAITGNNYALKREDARAYLPNNTICRKIYMTFTFKSLLKFLDLREDTAAQAEIRHYATSIGDWWRSVSPFTSKEACQEYIKPKLLCSHNISFSTSDLETAEEVVDVTVDDYIKAAGLDKEMEAESTTSEEVLTPAT